MDFFISIFQTFLYQPLLNALIFIYQNIPGHDFGLAVILLTVLIRIIFYPLMVKSIRSQKILSELQPKIQEIQQKYKEDKQRQSKEMMTLYQKEKINPFGDCLPLLLQLPILIALYRVFWKGLEPGAMAYLYSFVPNPGTIDPSFFGLVNLAETSLVMALIAGVAQFFQSKMLLPKTKSQKQGGGQMAQFSGMMQKQMLYFFPIFTVLILLRLPSAIGLYWIVTALFSIGQQHLIMREPTKHQDERSSSPMREPAKHQDE